MHYLRSYTEADKDVQDVMPLIFVQCPKTLHIYINCKHLAQIYTYIKQTSKYRWKVSLREDTPQMLQSTLGNNLAKIVKTCKQPRINQQKSNPLVDKTEILTVANFSDVPLASQKKLKIQCHLDHKSILGNQLGTL